MMPGFMDAVMWGDRKLTLQEHSQRTLDDIADELAEAGYSEREIKEQLRALMQFVIFESQSQKFLI